MDFKDSSFEKEVLKASQVVLVDFWAPWCGPCQLMKPIIEELEKEIDSKKIKIGKMNVDENPKTAEKYEIMSIPALLFFKGGKVVKQLNGCQEKESLKKEINGLI